MNKTINKRDEKFGIYLYVLVLQNDKYYVGITNDPRKRFQKHRSGNSIKFLNENLPIIDIQTILLKTADRSEALKIETETAIQLIQKFGIEMVYGGKITGEIQHRIVKYKSYFEELKNNYYKTLEDYGNYVEVDSKNQAGIENIIGMINNSYDTYLVEYRTEIICRVL